LLLLGQPALDQRGVIVLSVVGHAVFRIARVEKSRARPFARYGNEVDWSGKSAATAQGG
jgi:hypothetical protein